MKKLKKLTRKHIDLIETVSEADPYLVQWSYLSTDYKLPERFIEKYVNYFDWIDLCLFQELSEKLISKYKNKIPEQGWHDICLRFQLSEKFIEKHMKYLPWNYVLKFQKLTPGFVVKYIDKITKDIFDNPCYKTLPNSVKLLLEAKLK